MRFMVNFTGFKSPRKHINWQLGQNCQYNTNVKIALMQTTTAEAQLSLIDKHFEQWNEEVRAKAS